MAFEPLALGYYCVIDMFFSCRRLTSLTSWYDHQERPISKEAMVNLLVPIRHQLRIVPKLTKSTKEYLI